MGACTLIHEGRRSGFRSSPLIRSSVMIRPPLAIVNFPGKYATASETSEGMVTQSISDVILDSTCPIICYVLLAPLPQVLFAHAQWEICFRAIDAQYLFDDNLSGTNYPKSASNNRPVSSLTSLPPGPTGPTHAGQPSWQRQTRTISNAPVSRSACNS